MSTIIFFIVTLITAIISELAHPDIRNWVPFSIVAYIILGLVVGLGIILYFKKKKKMALEAGLIAFFIFWEYAIITVFSYLRMVDDFLSRPMEEKMMYGIGAVVFLAIAILGTKKLDTML